MSPTPGSSPLDPDEAGRREFTKVRKGYDPVEVKAHLLAFASEVKTARGVESDLRERVAELERRLAVAEEPDEHQLTRVLGDETVRIVEAARSAATDIRERAEESAARLVQDAAERASRLTAEAEELRVGAATESDELVSAARSRSEEMLSESREAAERIRADAESEAASVREAAAELLEQRTAEVEAHAEAARFDAEAAAAATIAHARDAGRAMLAEAREARERMLRDLAERRRAGRRQLEALRAGHERLLAAFAAARDAVDGATDELSQALPAARDAADEAARAVHDDIDVAVAELDASIGGTDLSEALEAEIATEAQTETESRGTDAGVASPDAERRDAGAAVDREPAATPPDSDSADSETADDETADEAEVLEFNAVVEDAPHLRLVAVNDVDPDDDDDDDDEDDDEDDEDDDEDDEDDDDEDDDGGRSSSDGSDGVVDDLFARLRADRAATDVTDAPSAVDDPVNDEVDTTPDEGDEGDDGDAEPTAPRAALTSAELLDRRDLVLAPIEKTLTRRLKRQLSDRENDVMDRVRRHKRGPVTIELLAEGTEFGGALRDAAGGGLDEAAAAGVAFLVALDAERSDMDPVASDDVPEVSTADLLGPIEEQLVVPLNERLARTIEESPDLDRDELVGRVRSVFREWRNDRVPEVGGDLCTLAFNLGIRAAARTDAELSWIVDFGGLPCPDGEDNHLAGGVVNGSMYPTGCTNPPAHPGCRCLLVPVGQ